MAATGLDMQMEGLTVSSKPSTRIIEFKGEFVGQHFWVQMWLLPHAVFVWVGLDGTPVRMGSMSMAVKTRYDALPLSSSLLGAGTDEIEQQMAQRLVLRTGKQVFVSCNLPDEDMDLSAYVERTILQHLRDVSP